MVPNAIEEQVVALCTFCEVLLCVVDDPICTNGPDHVEIPGTAYAGHFRAKRLGDLHCECTHTSRSTVNQDLLTCLDVSLVAKALQCGIGGHGYGCCLLKCHVSWLHDQY